MWFILYHFKIYVEKISICGRHFSHVTKSRIFKNLNLRKKADRNFRGNFLKNHFRHLKLYSNHPSWLARSRYYMGTFWKKKGWSSHVWEGQPFKFCSWEFNAKEESKTGKQVFLLNLRVWTAQKPKIGSSFYGKTFIKKILQCKS